MEQYATLAKHYDQLMGDFNYDGYFEFIQNITSGYGVDLCCGSGKATIMLAKKGCTMIGVDSSIQMLNVAMINAKKHAQNIQWLNINAQDFEPIRELDFALCMCDGINYMSKQDFIQLVSNLDNYIRQNGYFIFDISSRYKLEKVLGNNVFCDETDDVAYIWSNNYDPIEHTSEMQLSIFERQLGDNYKRSEEQHLQYAHSKQDILNCLKKQWIVNVYDGENFTKDNEKSKRLLFVCQHK